MENILIVPTTSGKDKNIIELSEVSFINKDHIVLVNGTNLYTNFEGCQKIEEQLSNDEHFVKAYVGNGYDSPYFFNKDEIMYMDSTRVTCSEKYNIYTNRTVDLGKELLKDSNFMEVTSEDKKSTYVVNVDNIKVMDDHTLYFDKEWYVRVDYKSVEQVRERIDKLHSERVHEDIQR